ncbi:Envelope glycoprotein gp160 [Frankliniella fusca]|uniref:Envelope glycoprotein gp160 n=1 Tax=Frankliniella fusca TaxID=407009 RepID=A0AAE1I754_9NEOP|nr:Envelope glycoprotein gp160 [Frankliniella fusca]
MEPKVDLVERGFLELLDEQDETFHMHVTSPTCIVSAMSGKEVVKQADSSSQVLITSESKQFFKGLVQHESLESKEVRNYKLRLTEVASAATAGSLTLSDAEEFIKLIDEMQKGPRISDPLQLLYISLTVEMSKQLFTDDQYNRSNTSINILFEKKGKLKRIWYDEHPDRSLFESLDLTRQNIDMWLLGNPRLRKDGNFTAKLTKMWSALCMRDVCANPSMLEEAIGKYWWCAPLALMWIRSEEFMYKGVESVAVSSVNQIEETIFTTHFRVNGLQTCVIDILQVIFLGLGHEQAEQRAKS